MTQKYCLAALKICPFYCILDRMQVETGQLVDCVSQLS